MGSARVGTESGQERDRKQLIELTNALPDAVVVVDARGITRFVNRAAEELFGRRREELLGQPAPFSSGDRAAAHIEIVAAGETRQGELRMAPIDWAGEQGYLASIRDVTEQHAQRARRKREEELEAVGRLAGGIAHDFNNLLTGMITFTTLVRDSFAESDERKADLGKVLTSCQRAVELTKNLLAFSRRERTEPRATDLNSLIESCGALIGRLLDGRALLEKNLETGLWPVLVDKAHFEMIIGKLVINARDAMPSGGTVRIETRNDSTTVLGECVLCRISDTGQGMSEDVKQNLFHPFFTTKAPGAGSGLGLATVYGLLLQAKGTIDVDSVIGRGTAFDLRFPRTHTVPSSSPPGAPVDVPVRENGSNRAILLAEDEPIVRQSVGRMLRRGGYTFFEARSGREALEVYAEHRDEIGLALLDVVMPELSGPETAMRLRAESPLVKILFMSGYPRDLFDTNEEARALGPLIQKPMTEAALLTAVRQLLDAEDAAEPATGAKA